MSVSSKMNLTSSDGTTAQFAIGSTAEVKGATWVYCKATAAAIALGDVLSGANAGVVESATTTTATALGTAGGFCAIAQFAVAASEYFWAARGPFHLREDGSTAFYARIANVTAGNLLYSTATAGTLDDDSSGSTIPLIGLTLVTTITTLAATPVKSWRVLGWVK
jgi:hypothetical protein